MGKSKILQIIVIVLGLGALAYLGFWLLSGESKAKLSDRLYGVDVVTGEVFYFDASKGVVWPAINPGTGVASVLPGQQESETVWVIGERHRAVIGEMTPKSDKVDMETGRITVANAVPKSGR